MLAIVICNNGRVIGCYYILIWIQGFGGLRQYAKKRGATVRTPFLHIGLIVSSLFLFDDNLGDGVALTADNETGGVSHALAIEIVVFNGSAGVI